MAGGGGGGHTTATTTSYTSSLPEYAEPYYKSLAQRAETESMRDYVPYEGQRIAQFGGDTQAGFQTTRNVAARGTPGADTAAQTAQGIARYQGDPAAAAAARQGTQYQAGNISTRRLDQAGIDEYMNPYISNVLDRAQKRAQDRYTAQRSRIGLQAARSGAFGGARQGVQEALAARDIEEQLQDIEAEQLARGYGQAVQTYQAEETRGLQAAQAQEAARRAAAQQRLAASEQLAKQQQEIAKTRLAGADLAGRTDQLRQQLGLQQAQALQQIGQRQEAKTQAGLEQAYSDFVNQRDHPRQQLAFMSQILHGMPVTPQQEVRQSVPAPNPLSQALGTGIGAYGLMQALGGRR